MMGHVASLPARGPVDRPYAREVHEVEKERQANRKPDRVQVDADTSVMDLPEDAANKLSASPPAVASS